MKNPTLLKYAVASGGDSAMYSYVNTFWLFYLTSVSGIPPAIAGTITAVSAVAYAVAGPFFAGLSDRSRHKLGRRRPFLLFSALPLGFLLCLMFAKLPFEGGLRIALLLVLGLGFWTLFAAFFIPHLAWGAEIATDYHDRTTIRTFSYVMYSVGAFFSTVLPTTVVAGFIDAGVNESSSWLFTTIFLAIISAGSILFTGMAIREPARKDETPAPKFSLKAMAIDYWQVLKLRPLRLLTAAVFTYLIANTLVAADRMYVLTYQLKYSGAAISAIMLLTGVLGIVLAAPMMKLAKRFDKRAMLIGCLGISGCLVVAMRFVGISNLPTLLIFLFVFVTATTAYWQLIPATFYDICEVDEYENHVKRAGTITSIMPIAGALSSAVGMQLLGLWLQLRGFESGAETQSASALSATLDCLTIVPGIAMILATIAMIRFPITKQKFAEIKQALNERNAQTEHDTE
jgi:GPH family glycoside/pentoside/hexuronide:cation symporter